MKLVEYFSQLRRGGLSGSSVNQFFPVANRYKKAAPKTGAAF